MELKKIQFTEPHRKKHFDFFRNFDQPHFNICANVDVTKLLKLVKSKGFSFNTVMVYCVSKIANDIVEFKQRVRNDYAIEYDIVHPSFSVATEVSDVFSFCPVAYRESFSAFYEAATEMIEKVKKNPIFEDEERDDYLFLSSIPWISFTGTVHAMHYTPPDSVPRITWGKWV